MLQTALHTIRQLVEDFTANQKAFLSPAYQESQVRQDFIDKFFTALGWDVTHTVQKNPYEQEVKIENRVSTQSSQRRADYAFFTAPNFRDVQFFAEAKKPAHNLHNADYYHQTIRYGWNAGTPIAVLTDFEEFHVLDCRYKPDIKDALNREIFRFHFSEYAKEETFSKIFYLFGRDAVANGSLEKFSAELPKPRGKALHGGLFKGGYKSVDEDFLETLDEYRKILADTFRKENNALDGEELTEAVQRTLDRLVFIRFLEDKGIEEPTIIGLYGNKGAWKSFAQLCKRLEPKYNGLIFKPHKILDAHTFNPPNDITFATICAELSDPTSPYDFDKIPISILGSIYERFLGKVIRPTPKGAKVEEKPEVRKAGGVYYTPEYIVRYIVSETVGKIIEGKLPEEIAAMSFADIACGSGSFLIEVYSQLINYHERWYNSNQTRAKKEDVFERDGHLHVTLKKKKEILLNNIYGVDIDFQATEVTQLSLYLKLLENVSLTETHQLGLFKEHILPNLTKNIVCGNSLIGTDITGLFETENTDRLKPMNFEDAFPAIMKRGGFDAIVGNPPYIQSRSEQFSDIEKQYYYQRYATVEYQINTFGLFIEKSIQNLKKNGLLGYIIPNYWLSTRYDKKLRDFLFIDNHTTQIINTYKIFLDAIVDTVIIIAQKTTDKIFPKKIELKSIDRNYKTISERLSAIEQQNWSFQKGEIVKSNTENVVISFSTKINIPGEKKLSDFFVLKFGMKPYEEGKGTPKQTKEMMKSKIYDATKKKNKDYYPLLRAKNIHRYSLDWSGDWIKYGSNLAAPRTFELFTGSRILMQRILSSDRFFGVYTSETFICNTDVITLKPKTSENHHNILFFVGILLTKLTAVFIKSNNVNLDRDAFPKINTETLESLPIPIINFDNTQDKSRHDAIVKLVEQMLEAKQKISAAKTDSETSRLELHIQSLDRKIDEAVYELYGLTEEEIKIIEA